MITILLVVSLMLGLWLLVCGSIWFWYFALGGNKSDASGNLGPSILALPIVPFALAYYKVRKLFRGKE